MNDFYVLILFLLIIKLIYLLVNLLHFNKYQSKKYREGFSIPGLSDMSNTIDKLVDVADDIPKEIITSKMM